MLKGPEMGGGKLDEANSLSSVLILSLRHCLQGPQPPTPAFSGKSGFCRECLSLNIFGFGFPNSFFQSRAEGDQSDFNESVCFK